MFSAPPLLFGPPAIWNAAVDDLVCRPGRYRTCSERRWPLGQQAAVTSATRCWAVAVLHCSSYGFAPHVLHEDGQTCETIVPSRRAVSS